jgi:serine/threonine protein kinase
MHITRIWPMGSKIDSDLLFGVQALRQEFLTSEGLLAALAAWLSNSDRPLSDVLVELKLLKEDERSLLDIMTPIDSEEILGGSLSAEVESRRIMRSADASIVPGPCSRFRRGDFHAKGGLGQVFHATDAELNRDVALKEILDEYADEAPSRDRFVLEAQITGGLEHPGIVPVYGLGEYSGGRPYYAMRFIRGSTLKETIAAFHEDEILQKDAGARGLALRKLLRRFLDVCNAIGYAHSRGVLHLDIKPGNIIIGKYGETLIVDWGLAKAKGRSYDVESSPERPLMLDSASDLAESLRGSVQGTPAYMSPEQASPIHDDLGPRSDVYSLGATLYCLLTGKPPFEGGDLKALLQAVRKGDFPKPRTIDPRIDRALEAVCLKAMALHPKDRYATAGALAENVERWLADEPVDAWSEPCFVRMRRWTRRYKARVYAGISAVLVFLAISAPLYLIERSRIRQRDDRARALLSLAIEYGGKARHADTLVEADSRQLWANAVFDAHRASDLLVQPAYFRLSSHAPLRRQVATTLHNLEDDREASLARFQARTRNQDMLSQLESARAEGSNLNVHDPGTDFDYRATTAAYRRAFELYGIDLQSSSRETAVRLIRASTIHDDLVASIDHWASLESDSQTRDALLAIARDADPDVTRSNIRGAIAINNGELILGPADDTDIVDQPAATILVLENALLRQAMRSPTDRNKILLFFKRARDSHPSDLWINHGIGHAYMHASPPQLDLAVQYLRVAVGLRPESPGLNMFLGYALEQLGSNEEAIDAYRRAARFSKKILTNHYQCSPAHYSTPATPRRHWKRFAALLIYNPTVTLPIARPQEPFACLASITRR